MTLVVCPDDGEPLKVVERRSGPDGVPLLECPSCGMRFLLTRAGLVQTD